MTKVINLTWLLLPNKVGNLYCSISDYGLCNHALECCNKKWCGDLRNLDMAVWKEGDRRQPLHTPSFIYRQRDLQYTAKLV